MLRNGNVKAVGKTKTHWTRDSFVFIAALFQGSLSTRLVPSCESPAQYSLHPGQLCPNPNRGPRALL